MVQLGGGGFDHHMPSQETPHYSFNAHQRVTAEINVHVESTCVKTSSVKLQ